MSTFINCWDEEDWDTIPIRYGGKFIDMRPNDQGIWEAVPCEWHIWLIDEPALDEQISKALEVKRGVLPEPPKI